MWTYNYNNGNDWLQHSAAGTTWYKKNAKYIKKIGNKYIYDENKVNNKNYRRVTSGSGKTTAVINDGTTKTRDWTSLGGRFFGTTTVKRTSAGSKGLGKYFDKVVTTKEKSRDMTQHELNKIAAEHKDANVSKMGGLTTNISKSTKYQLNRSTQATLNGTKKRVKKAIKSSTDKAKTWVGKQLAKVGKKKTV